MKNKTKTLLSLLLVLVLAAALLPTALADEAGVVYTNADTGYRIYILDDDDLLTATEEAALMEDMQPITQYGNIIFWSTSEPTGGNEIEQARLKRRALTDLDSSGIFVINMSARKITFQSYGTIYDSLTRSFARTVTDNVSHYATRGDYYTCASAAYGQVLELLRGNTIAQPMKYLSYAVISLMLGLLIASLFVFGKKQNTVYKKLLLPLSLATVAGILIKNTPSVHMSHENRRYSPPSSSSCGGGGSSCGGGGSSCGGGGSSSF